MKLVQRSFGYAGNKPFPDARRPPRFEAVCLPGPFVEAANDRDLMSIWRPHAKTSAGLAAASDKVCAHLLVDTVIAALVEEVQILIRKQERKSANRKWGVRHFCLVTASFGDKSPTDMSVPETTIDRCRVLPNG